MTASASAGRQGGAGRPDIASRADLEALLRRFYAAAFDDPLIGPLFVDVARMDLAHHLPRITDFWESALLRTARYQGNALAPHAALHAREPLTAAHFGRWVQLWRATLDGGHAGPVTERAKAQAQRMAVAMLRRLGDGDTGGGSGGFVPLAAVRLASGG
ncbi:group III truncated hemoglobin [Kitasatospora sp. NPDC049285]|uniref:group III truncated hemoglobin n=1 Tax=Kitasatospora sp. NPDC049285 TaxID=3157096 RepID=UPI0034423E95